jgi:hypothetical protein
MKRIMRTVFLFLFAATTALSAQAVAFLSDLRGEVAVDGNPRPMLLSEVAKGQKITVGRDSQASVMYIANGKEYILKGPGEYLVKDTEISGAVMPPVSRSTEWRASPKVLTQVAQTSAASVRMRSIAQPKVDPNAHASFPSEGQHRVAESGIPLARRRPEGAGGVRAPRRRPGETRAHREGGRRHVPGSGEAASRNRVCVDRDGGGAEVGAGKFRTLPADALARVEKQRPAERAEFSDRLLFTLLLQEMGAVQEARESWARLSQERADLPELSALAR